MTMELYAAYGLVGAGLALLAWTMQQLMAMRVNAKVANEYFVKLLRTGNRERARKLAGAAPRSYFVALVAAIDAADAGRDPRAAFDAAAEAFAKRWAAHVSRGWLGALLVGGGVVFALSVDAMPKVLLGGAIVGAMLAGLLVQLRFHARDALAAAKETVVPEMLAK